MKNKFLGICFILITLFSCKSTSTIAEISLLKKIVADKNFELTFDSAIPVAFVNVRGIENLFPPGSNRGLINLVNNDNYLKVENDSIKMDLPFFGEKHLETGYGKADGVNYFGKITGEKTSYNTKKNSYSIDYSLKAKNESLDLNLTMFANKSATLRVNSSNRSTISYNGKWKEIKE